MVRLLTHYSASRFSECMMASWRVEEGAELVAGQPICDIEVEKASLTLNSPCDCWLRRIYVDDGEYFTPGMPLAALADDLEEPVPDILAKNTMSPTREVNPEDSEIDLRDGPPEPLTPIRAVIARRMIYSKRTIPCFYLTTKIDMSGCSSLRDKLKREGGSKATYNDMIIKACGLALTKYPLLMAIYTPEGVVPRNQVNIGFAALREDSNLLVPVIKNVAAKGLLEIAAETRELSRKARDGKLTEFDCSEGVFSVSNLGAFDIESFIAIVNPGETAILAVGKITEEPCVVDGKIEIRPVTRITISADHRTVDGAYAASFNSTLKKILEKPDSLL